MRIHNIVKLSALGVSALFIAACGGGLIGAAIAQVVATLAGKAVAGALDGPASVATFNNPVNLTFDNSGNLVVSDFDNDLLRLVTPDGTVSTMAVPAGFQRPFGIEMDDFGNLYVETDGNDLGERNADTGTIWKFNMATGDGEVVVRNVGRPRGLLALPNGNIVMSDVAHHTIRILDPVSKTITPLAGMQDVGAFADGDGDAARFNRPYGMALTPGGQILVADQDNNRIRMVSLSGTVTTYAGDGIADYRDGVKGLSRFDHPQDVSIDNAGNVFVSDHDNFRIRRVGADEMVTTVAGNGTQGYADGAALEASFFGMEGIKVAGDGGAVYVADGNNGTGADYNRVRVIKL